MSWILNTFKRKDVIECWNYLQQFNCEKTGKENDLLMFDQSTDNDEFLMLFYDSLLHKCQMYELEMPLYPNPACELKLITKEMLLKLKL